MSTQQLPSAECWKLFKASTLYSGESLNPSFIWLRWLGCSSCWSDWNLSRGQRSELAIDREPWTRSALKIKPKHIQSTWIASAVPSQTGRTRRWMPRSTMQFDPIYNKMLLIVKDRNQEQSRTKRDTSPLTKKGPTHSQHNNFEQW